MNRDENDLRIFERERADLLSLAYRMLGEAGRAQELVQDAWLRWHGRNEEVENPRAFLITIVTRLCLNELESARARHEEARVTLPEPVAPEVIAPDVERISMAFLLLLERLSPAERAAVLLHEVFDYSHDDIAKLLNRSPASSRKLLERGRAHLASGRKMLTASREQHAQLLQAFLVASQTGDVATMLRLLADDATLIADAGPEDGRVVNGVRALRKPLHGAAAIANFVANASRPGQLVPEQRDLNGRPAVVFTRDGAIFAALLVEIADGKIHGLYFQADPARLRFVH